MLFIGQTGQFFLWMKGKSMEETRHLIQKTRSIKYRDLPDEVIDRAKYFILDYIGVSAGSTL